MYSKAVPTALRGLGRLNGVSLGSGAACMRRFSTTPSYGVRAIYSETDNTELNSILKEIQESIILPAYLPPKQRRIVFDPTKRTYLEQNPIDIEVEGHEYRFKTIDVTKDVPAARGMLWKALGAMKTREDWDNLATILAGFRKARIMLSLNQQGKLMRRAIEGGQVGVLIECLKQARETGLYLINKEQFVRIYLAINRKIHDANGDLAEIRQATRWGEIILDLVQRPESMEKMAVGRDTKQFLHFSALARGMLLHARASLAKAKQQAEEPIDGDLIRIKDDAVLLSSLWAQHLEERTPLSQLGELAELNPTRSERVVDAGRALNGSGYVHSLAWVGRGIKLAEELASTEAAPLLPLVESLDKHAGEIIQAGGANGSQWAKEYEAYKRGA